MRHRLISTAVPSTIAATLALVLLAAGCGSGAVWEERRAPTPEESMPTDLPAPLGSTGLECGASFLGTAGGELAVTGRFPNAVSSDEQMVSGTVEVSPTRSDARGVVTPQADAFLVRDGRIVTLPMPQDAVGRQLDLTDGTAEQLPAMASLIVLTTLLEVDQPVTMLTP
jgi:hypothetical protein